MTSVVAISGFLLKSIFWVAIALLATFIVGYLSTKRKGQDKGNRNKPTSKSLLDKRLNYEAIDLPTSFGELLDHGEDHNNPILSDSDLDQSIDPHSNHSDVESELAASVNQLDRQNNHPKKTSPTGKSNANVKQVSNGSSDPLSNAAVGEKEHLQDFNDSLLDALRGAPSPLPGNESMSLSLLPGENDLEKKHNSTSSSASSLSILSLQAPGSQEVAFDSVGGKLDDGKIDEEDNATRQQRKKRKKRRKKHDDVSNGELVGEDGEIICSSDIAKADTNTVGSKVHIFDESSPSSSPSQRADPRYAKSSDGSSSSSSSSMHKINFYNKEGIDDTEANLYDNGEYSSPEDDDKYQQHRGNYKRDGCNNALDNNHSRYSSFPSDDDNNDIDNDQNYYLEQSDEDTSDVHGGGYDYDNNQTNSTHSLNLTESYNRDDNNTGTFSEDSKSNFFESSIKKEESSEQDRDDHNANSQSQNKKDSSQDNHEDEYDFDRLDHLQTARIRLKGFGMDTYQELLQIIINSRKTNTIQPELLRSFIESELKAQKIKTYQAAILHRMIQESIDIVARQQQETVNTGQAGDDIGHNIEHDSEDEKSKRSAYNKAFKQVAFTEDDDWKVRLNKLKALAYDESSQASVEAFPVEHSSLPSSSPSSSPSQSSPPHSSSSPSRSSSSPSSSSSSSSSPSPTTISTTPALASSTLQSDSPMELKSQEEWDLWLSSGNEPWDRLLHTDISSLPIDDMRQWWVQHYIDKSKGNDDRKPENLGKGKREAKAVHKKKKELAELEMTQEFARNYFDTARNQHRLIFDSVLYREGVFGVDPLAVELANSLHNVAGQLQLQMLACLQPLESSSLPQPSSSSPTSSLSPSSSSISKSLAQSPM